MKFSRIQRLSSSLVHRFQQFIKSRVFEMKNKFNTNNYVVQQVKENATENVYEDDYVVNSIGAFGKWQLLVCVVISLTRFIAHWNMMSVIFLAPKTEFACVQFNDNVRNDVKNSTCYKDCAKYEYYQDVFVETLVTKFDLICENAWLASFTQTILMFGLLVGVSFFGWISDRFGRRKALISSGAIAFIFMFATPFSPNYWAVACMRFCVGTASGGIISLTSVYILEIVGPQHAAVAISMSMLPDGISEITLAVFAYFAPTWGIFIFICAALTLLIVFITLTLPETPRWAMAKENTDLVVDLMTKAAKFNGLNTAGIRDKVIENKEKLKIIEASNATYLDLFRTKTVAVKTVSSLIVWFVAGFCYFGLNQYISQIGSDLFITVIIMGLAQAATFPVMILSSKLYGRRNSAIVCSISIGVTMSSLIFIPEGTWGSTIVGVLGLGASNTLFFVMYTLTSELYPTPIRNMGFSLSSASSKLGAMLAPFILNIRPYWIVSLIFAVLPFLAVVFCLILPETKGKKLSDTLEE